MADPQSTELFPAGDPNVLYVVDISSYVFRAYHALPPLSSPSGEPIHAVLGVTSMLLKLVEQRKPAYIAIAMDSRTKSFRKELYDDYKANRPKAPEDLKLQMGRVSEVVRAMGMEVLQQDGMEADDVIASTVRRARERDLSVVVVSADKDLLQLVGPHVLMLDTGRDRVFDEAATVKKLGVPPAQVRDYLSLVGDTSDNVPGVPSVGPKTAVKLLEQFGTFEQMYARLEEVSKLSLRKKLQAHREQAYLSQRLVTLKDDVRVEFDLDRLRAGERDLPALQALFTELGFVRLLSQLAEEEGHAGAGRGPEVAPVQDHPPADLLTDEAQLKDWLAELDRAQPLVVLSVCEGSRPMGDDLVGLALKSADRAVYVPIGHRYLGVGAQIPHGSVGAVVKDLLGDELLLKITADAKREHLACRVMGIKLRGVAHDVGLCSYLLHADRHGHGLSDVHLALFGHPVQGFVELIKPTGKMVSAAERPVEEVAAFIGGILASLSACYQAQLPLIAEGETEALLKQLELPLSRVLAEMENTGIAVDTDLLGELAKTAQVDMAELEQRCKDLAGHDFNVSSPRQLEKILFDELQLPVIKKTKTARSTDHSVLEELSAQHPLPEAILEHRMLAKLKSTYLDALPREVSSATGRIHTDFRQTVAATGRLSSSDPNLQNIPIRSALGRRVRDAFIPEAGWQMMSADYSQIELRVLAHISQDAELLAAYREGDDVHVRTAAAIFGVDPGDVTREMRGQAKTVNFAVIYGQTEFALARNLRINRNEARRYIEAFFEKYSGVADYMARVVDEGRARGFVTTLSGRVRQMPELASQNRMKRLAAERVARNTPIQGTAADIIKRAMIDVAGAIAVAGLQSRMLLTVHDELVLEAPTSERALLSDLVVTQMQGAMALDVPLLVEFGWGPSWGAAH